MKTLKKLHIKLMLKYAVIKVYGYFHWTKNVAKICYIQYACNKRCYMIISLTH